MLPLLKTTTCTGYRPYIALIRPLQSHYLSILLTLNRPISTTHPSPSKPRLPPSSQPQKALPNTSPNPKPPRSRPITTIFSGLTTFLSIIALLTFTKTHIFELKTVSGASMHPFLNADYDSSLQRDIVWVNKWRAGEDIKRGMVVAFYSPNHPNVVAVKRVVAIEGDVVVTKAPYPFEREDVPVGHVWVEGDVEGRGKSFDSNYYGPVSKSLIEGKVTHVVWPADKRCRIRPEDWKASPRVLEGRRKVEKIEFY